ncbi:MAG: hypothetical protein ACSHYB_18595 [Roseibacillus sp.]
MKSAITLIFAGAVLLVSGQYFGWWMAPIPGMEMVPSYQQKRSEREGERSVNRQATGLDDENGESISDNDTKRRAAALKNGGGVGN